MRVSLSWQCYHKKMLRYISGLLIRKKNGIWFTEFANGWNVDTDVPAYLKLGKKSCASTSTLVGTEVYGLKV